MKPEEIRLQWRRLGRQLAAYRKTTRLTQAQLAGKLRYERTSLTHIEAGRQTAPRSFWQDADNHLAANGDLLAQFDEVERLRRSHEHARQPAMDTASTEHVWTPHVREALTAITDSWQTPNHSNSHVAAASPMALHWLLHADIDEHVGRLDGWRRIGTKDVLRIRAVRAHLKEIDNSLGGGAALPMAHTYLDQQITPLLSGGQYDDHAGRSLFAAVAELTLEVGWMAYDAGQQTRAREEMLHALRLAHAAGNRLFAGRIMTALSHQALSLGRVSEAIDLAQTARQGIEHVTTPKASAMAAAMEACAYAAAGDQARCHAALRSGEQALEHERSSSSDQPAWLDFDDGGLAGHAARALRDLGDASEASRYAEYSIKNCLPGHTRTRVQRTAILATALIQNNELDRVAALGNQIIDDAWQLHSEHVQDEVSGLAESLRHEKSPAIREFLERAGEITRAPLVTR